VKALKVLVTGHTGFVGRHLVPYLLKKNIEVVGLARTVSRNSELSPPVEILGDLTENPVQILDEFKSELDGTNAIIHLAAYRPLVRSTRLDFFDQAITGNVVSTLSVLRIAQQLHVDKILYASTKAVYGLSKQLVSEEDPPLPQTNYGRSKLMAEHLLQSFTHLYGGKIRVLRIASIFGPLMSCNLVFATFLNQALQNSPLTVNFHDSQFEPLALIYVKDVLTAFYAALMWENERIFDVFNISGPCPITTQDLATMIINQTHSKSQITIRKTPLKKTGIKLSHTKASIILGWTPHFTYNSAIRNLLPSWTCE